MPIIAEADKSGKTTEVFSRLKKLIFSKDLYGFLSVLDEITTCGIPTDEIIRESAKVLSMSLYRDDYEGGVPQSMMGFCAASQMKKYLPVEDQIQPLTQMLWLAAVEEKKPPYKLQKISVKTGGNVLTRLRRYQEAMREKDLKRAYGLFEGFFRNERERETFFDFLLGENLKDGILKGQKYTYFVKGWQLAKLLKWRDVRLMFFPMNHLLATAPKDPTYWEMIRALVGEEKFEKWSGNSTLLDAEDQEKLEEIVLSGKQDKVILHVAELLKSGKSPKAVLDGILVSASQLVAVADNSTWEGPINAFNYTDSAHYFAHMSKDPMTALAPFAAALVVNRASRELGAKKSDDFSVEPYSGERDPVLEFKYAVVHFDTDASVSTVKKVLQGGDRLSDLYRMVLMTASMNDAVVCRGRDMQYVYHSLNAYEMSSSPSKEKLLYGMARFLGYINKNYILYREAWG